MTIEIVTGIGLLIVAFIFTLITTKAWIKIAKANNLEGKDMNKSKKNLVAEAGGVAVIGTFILSILFYLYLKTFLLKTETNFIETLTLLLTILSACFIGFIDDILGWKKGIRQSVKLLLTLPIAIPLMVINAGTSTIVLPILGSFDFGFFFPLIILIGVVGATNGVNLLAGYNGLEASLGSIILAALGIISLITGQAWLALISFVGVACLLGFLIYNKYPAKIFPGDSLTYPIGALIASIAILGNMEKAAVILFIPFILEGFLKLRSKFKAENFGEVNKDNSLEPPYKKNYSLTHISIRLLKKLKKKAFEKEVVFLLIFFQLIFTIIVLAGFI